MSVCRHKRLKKVRPVTVATVAMVATVANMGLIWRRSRAHIVATVVLCVARLPQERRALRR